MKAGSLISESAFFVPNTPSVLGHFCSMDILSRWYINEDFEEGVELLRQYRGNTEGLLQYVDKGYIPKSVREVLEMRLNALKFEEVKPFASQTIVHNTQSYTNDLDIPPALKERSIMLLKERDNIRSKIRYEKDAGTRLIDIRDLMERIVPQLDEVFKAINNYHQTGALPLFMQQEGEKAGEPTFEDGLKLGTQKMLKLQNLTSRVSKLRGMIPKLKGEELTKYQNELTEKEGEIVKIKSELGLIS